MRGLLFIIAFILLVGWVTGLIYHAGGLIHILLAIAIISFLLGFIEPRKYE